MGVGPNKPLVVKVNQLRYGFLDPVINKGLCETSNFAIFTFSSVSDYRFCTHSYRVKPKSYQREGQPHKTEN